MGSNPTPSANSEQNCAPGVADLAPDAAAKFRSRSLAGFSVLFPMLEHQLNRLRNVENPKNILTKLDRLPSLKDIKLVLRRYTNKLSRLLIFFVSGEKFATRILASTDADLSLKYVWVYADQLNRWRMIG